MSKHALLKPTFSSPNIKDAMERLKHRKNSAFAMVKVNVDRDLELYLTQERTRNQHDLHELHTLVHTMEVQLVRFEKSLDNINAYRNVYNAFDTLHDKILTLTKDDPTTAHYSEELLSIKSELVRIAQKLKELGYQVTQDTLPSLGVRFQKWVLRQLKRPYRYFAQQAATPGKTEYQQLNELQGISGMFHYYLNDAKAFRAAFERYQASRYQMRKIEKEQELFAKYQNEMAPLQKSLSERWSTIESLLVEDEKLQRLWTNTDLAIKQQEKQLEVVTRRGFAKMILDKYEHLQMKAVETTTTDGCTGQELRLKNYQVLISELMDPAKSLVEVGIVAGYGTGSGKSAIGVACCKNYVMATKSTRSSSTQPPPILILVPNGNTMANWRNEFQKWCDPKEGWSIVDNKSKSDHTRTFVLQNKDTKPILIILHLMTVALDVSFPNAFVADSIALPMWDEALKSHPSVYASLSESDRQRIRAKDAKTRQEILKKNNIKLPKHGLVIVDEVQNLIDSSEINRISTTSLTVLAWANVIKSSDTQVKKLLFTATFADPDKPTLSFKLLNLVKPHKETRRMFEGFWRPALPVKDETAVVLLKQAYAKAEAAEVQYYNEKLKNPVVFQNELIDEYGGLLFYLTLENDARVYPQYKTDKNQVWQWDGSELKHVQREEQQQQQECPFPLCEVPKGWKEHLVYVPMSKAQEEKMRAMMKLDRAKQGKEDKDLAYGAPKTTTKASMLESWGTRFYADNPNPKMDVVLSLMDDQRYATDKFFVFRSTEPNVQQEFIKKGIPYLKKHGWEALDLPMLYKKAIGESKTSKKSIKEEKEETEDKIIAALVEKLYASLKPATNRVLALMMKRSDTKTMNENLLRRLMLEVFNDDRNLQGQYFKALFGDRTAKESLSLMHTKHAIMMDEPANETMAVQARARVTRYCSMKKLGPVEWNDMKLWQLVSIPSSWLTTTTTTKKSKAKKKTEVSGEWTNEEYQLQQRLKRGHDVSLKDILQEISGDCFLFREYNMVSKCFGGPDDETTLQNLPDQFCSQSNSGITVVLGNAGHPRSYHLSPGQITEEMNVTSWKHNCNPDSLVVLPIAGMRDAVWLVISGLVVATENEETTQPQQLPEHDKPEYVLEILQSLQGTGKLAHDEIVRWFRLWGRLTPNSRAFVRTILQSRVPESRADVWQMAAMLNKLLPLPRRRQRIADEIARLLDV